MTIRWLSDDYSMTIQWLSGDYPVTIRWLSDDYPMTIQGLSNDYSMTIQWLSQTFDLFFLMIIDLKRSVDRRWLFKSGATFILRRSCSYLAGVICSKRHIETIFPTKAIASGLIVFELSCGQEESCNIIQVSKRFVMEIHLKNPTLRPYPIIIFFQFEECLSYRWTKNLASFAALPFRDQVSPKLVS